MFVNKFTFNTEKHKKYSFAADLQIDQAESIAAYNKGS